MQVLVMVLVLCSLKSNLMVPSVFLLVEVVHYTATKEIMPPVLRYLLRLTSLITSVTTFLCGQTITTLKWLISFKQQEGQVAHWLERLQDYKFTVEYHPGQSC